MKKIYVCGPTVYSDPHIGNIRPIMAFDLYLRALKSLEGEYIFIHNITDIDDKIIAKAQEANTTEEAISQKYYKKYLSLMEQFNIVKPTHMPLVTENIEGIVSFIDSLVKTNHAYEVNGNVYFDVKSIKNYGSVSNRKLDQMEYEKGENKKHPADFALWKNTTVGVQFDSPWGKGRPGWHTECALFVDSILKGESLDIHGGGIDLLFPHHENENAHYEAKNNKPITKAWKHVGHINIDGTKMSKSLGNIMDAQTFIDTYGADLFRVIILSSSFTAPIDLNEDLIKTSQRTLERIKAAFNKVQLNDFKDANVDQEAKLLTEFNFALVMKELNRLIKEFNSSKLEGDKLFSLIKLLGFEFANNLISEEDKKLFISWEKARAEKDWNEADKIRDILSGKKLI